MFRATRVLFQQGSIGSNFSRISAQNKAAEGTVEYVNRSFVPMLDKARYDPYDFTIASQKSKNYLRKVKTELTMENSAFNAPQVNPETFYILPHLLSGYMSQSGNILHRSVTKLSDRKQRQMTKAIKRARSFGMLSSVARDVSTFPKRNTTL
ncbi:mitochondrial 37S ribosomal protein [Martiniozyma asiatica (nom. inval.)]|nr:mitochondrial 37S ribosomal protein [Martiniozyma asiatica]